MSQPDQVGSHRRPASNYSIRWWDALSHRFVLVFFLFLLYQKNISDFCFSFFIARIHNRAKEWESEKAWANTSQRQTLAIQQLWPVSWARAKSIEIRKLPQTLNITKLIQITSFYEGDSCDQELSTAQHYHNIVSTLLQSARDRRRKVKQKQASERRRQKRVEKEDEVEKKKSSHSKAKKKEKSSIEFNFHNKSHRIDRFIIIITSRSLCCRSSCIIFDSTTTIIFSFFCSILSVANERDRYQWGDFYRLSLGELIETKEFLTLFMIALAVSASRLIKSSKWNRYFVGKSHNHFQ